MQNMGLPTHAPQAKIAHMSNDFVKIQSWSFSSFRRNWQFTLGRALGLGANLLEQREQIPMPSEIRLESFVNKVWFSGEIKLVLKNRETDMLEKYLEAV